MSFDIATILSRIDFECLPSHMVGPAKLYISKGIEPGSFLVAVLANDLLGAITRADYINKALISSYHDFLVTIPMGSKGSYDAVAVWCDSGGLEGQFTKKGT